MKQQNKTMTIRIDQDTLDKLKDVSEKMHMTQSAFIRYLIWRSAYIVAEFSYKKKDV